MVGLGVFIFPDKEVFGFVWTPEVGLGVTSGVGADAGAEGKCT